MKRLILVLMMILILSSCKQKEEETRIETFTFLGEIFTFKNETTEGTYFESTNYDIGFRQDDNATFIVFMIDEDIYIATGTAEQYSIKLNGTTAVICQDYGVTCTGYDSFDFQEDISNLIAFYDQYIED